MKRAVTLVLTLAACSARVPSDVPYKPVHFQPGQELVAAYDCEGVKAGTKLVFAGMRGADVQAWRYSSEQVTIDRRCVEAAA